jgi:hypothetical protein
MIRYRPPVREYIGKMLICDECDAASHIHEGVVVQRTVTKGKERNIAVFNSRAQFDGVIIVICTNDDIIRSQQPKYRATFVSSVSAYYMNRP